MSKWWNRWMLGLLETIDRDVDTTFGCNYHCLCLWILSVGHVCSGFVMIVWASGLRMGVGRFSRPLRAVGVLAMPDAGLVTTQHIGYLWENLPGADMQRLVVPSIAVAVFIENHCVPDRVEVTHWVIAAMRELFNEDEGVEFWPSIVEAMKLPPSEEFLLPGSTEMRLFAGGSWDFPYGPCCGCFCHLTQLQTLRSPESCQGEGFGDTLSDLDVRH